MSGKVTLADVARQAGVSPSTASLTLSGKNADSISEATQSKVRQAAKSLGYSLKPRKPRTTKKGKGKTIIKSNPPAIALLVDQISLGDPFLEVFKTIREEADRHGLLVAIHETGGDSRTIKTIMSRIEHEHIVGVLFATHSTQEIDPELPESCKKPLILLNCYVKKETHWPAVLPGDLMGGFLATRHLLDQGRTRIAHITGELNYEAARDRMEGYKQALISDGQIPDERYIRKGKWYFDSGYCETKALIALPERPDAIFCANDNMSLGSLFALREAGIKVPEEVALIGYDNLPIVEQVIPRLSTMILPYGSMGKLALELLLTRLSGQPVENHTIKVKSELVARESTASPHQKINK